ncbi:GLPGLI family protein [Chryseobacterium sp. MYb264]|uniref:GLPGLI family protein n=1 Tax=Chryseobacterium sp. MYb264 TaxID=2745153 RepID=UPI002E14B811|nr:GLPGLI family protein [Chryseobacterium sp. MYb264]
MTRKGILLLLFILNFGYIFSQNNTKADLEVVYYFKIISDSLNRSSFIESNMILLCNKEKSSYFNPSMVKYFDYLNEQAKTIDKNNISTNNLQSIPKVRHNVWKDGNAITATIPLGMYFYSYREPELEWELLNEHKDIQEMNCQLAKVHTENDIFYAWYAPSIPFQDGPFRFKGLPGLILEVYNKNRTIEFSLASIKNNPEKNIEKIQKVATFDFHDKRDFFKARENWLEHPFISIVNKEAQKRAIENAKKTNVFLD